MVGKVVTIDFADSPVGVRTERDQTEAEASANTDTTVVLKRVKREERDNLLAETDWMASSDYNMTDAWKAYRQHLRDIPSQSGFPDTIDWGTKPE